MNFLLAYHYFRNFVRHVTPLMFQQRKERHETAEPTLASRCFIMSSLLKNASHRLSSIQNPPVPIFGSLIAYYSTQKVLLAKSSGPRFLISCWSFIKQISELPVSFFFILGLVSWKSVTEFSDCKYQLQTINYSLYFDKSSK